MISRYGYVALWVAVIGLLLPAAVWAQAGPQRAALVVRFADGAVETRCIAFDTPTISGAELLARSGLPVIVNYNSGLGGAVCSIGGQGCAFPGQDCFCKCQGSSCEYWAYYHGGADGWRYSDVGAGSYQVTDGAVEGWSWGKGNFASGTEPPPLRFADVCPAQPAPATLNGQERQASAPTAHPTAGEAGAWTRYAGILPFAAALAGGWVWLSSRRRRLTSLAPHPEPE